MPHVDEGQLHALLDGAIAQDSTEAREMRAHLEDCPQCRAQLEAASALRERASLILQGARPRSEEMPPFAAVVQRSTEPKPIRPRTGSPQRLAWAASIVLALGVGWIGRDFISPTRYDDLREGASSADMEPTMAPTSAAPAVQETKGQQQGGRDGAARVDAPRDAEGNVRRQNLAEAPAAAAIQSERAGGRATARTMTPVPAPAPSPPPVTEISRAQTAQKVAVLAADALARDSMVARAAGAPGRPAAVTPSLALESIVITGSAAPMNWSYVTIEEAQRVANRPVFRVPGLDLLNVGVGHRVGGVVVRVMQRLPDQNIVELIQEPVVGAAGQAAAGFAERREARNRATSDEAASRQDETGAWLVTVRKGEVLLTARATLPADSLRALLNRAR